MRVETRQATWRAGFAATPTASGSSTPAPPCSPSAPLSPAFSPRLGPSSCETRATLNELARVVGRQGRALHIESIRAFGRARQAVWSECLAAEELTLFGWMPLVGTAVTGSASYTAANEALASRAVGRFGS